MRTRDLARTAGGVAGVLLVTAGYGELHIVNPTMAALSYLLVVLVVAATGRLWSAVVTSAAAMLALNFFFMPPVGTFTIADPQNWVALLTFVAVSIVASQLSATARARADDATARRDELARLFDLSRDVLLVAEPGDSNRVLADAVARRFGLEFAAICLPQAGGWQVYAAGPTALALDRQALGEISADIESAAAADAPRRGLAVHRAIVSGGRMVRLVPLRLGDKTIGLLAVVAADVAPGALDALAGLVAIAIERVQFLEERKAAEMARHSEELKSALLASLGHDLRTPLTAMRVAASNLKADWLTDADRREQADLVLAQVERLTRIFQNILDMARIDAGGVSSEARWTDPSEIIDAARAQVEHALAAHDVQIDAGPPVAVRVDPRLTAGALAHLLENAAQYSPAATQIEVVARAGDDGLTLGVRDHGRGIADADLPRLFERFYRGAAAKRRVSGTGMGLAIARGLVGAEGGRVWAENCADGGARFWIAVPAAIRSVEPADVEVS